MWDARVQRPLLGHARTTGREEAAHARDGPLTPVPSLHGVGGGSEAVQTTVRRQRVSRGEVGWRGREASQRN